VWKRDRHKQLYKRVTIDQLSKDQKEALTKESLKSFADQFGENDLIKDIFFDILLEEIYGKENLYLSGKEE